MKIVAHSNTFERNKNTDHYFLEILVSYTYFGRFGLPEMILKAE